MLDIIREIKDHVIHLAHLVRNSNNAPLTDKIQAKEIERVKEKVSQILSEATGKSVESIYQDTERDNFMNSLQALEYGIIDKVIE